jgi:sterol desaturase/sphingolipid hydroxylase (fatty acid hydroxylase superfamily)
MLQVQRWLLESPIWLYFVMAPVFTILNLICASGLVNVLKARASRHQKVPADNTLTLDIGRTLLGTYVLLVGFAGVTIYSLARLPNVSWDTVSFYNTILGIAGVLIGYDLLFWAYHRLAHTDFFWYRVHYIHHESRSPNDPRHTLYNHPLDFILGTLCALLPLTIVPIHIVAAIICLFLQTFLIIASHSGQQIRVPGLYNSRHHDDHHLHCWGNYAQNIALVDMLFGTLISSVPKPPAHQKLNKLTSDEPTAGS